MIVEDDPAISQALCDVLAGWGYQSQYLSEFDDVARACLQARPDLILMDLNLPERNGFYWTREIRKFSSIPIVFISSADSSMNIVTALSQGADDYITKPFDMTVLVTKLQAILRRTYDYSSRVSILEHKNVRLDSDSNEVFYQSKSCELSKNEARILKILMENKERIVSREKLMDALWKTDCYIDENTLSVNVNRLRRKLESIGIDDYILTRKGSGYMV